MTQDEFNEKWWDEFEAFKASHPDMPETKEIPVLNLIMKKSEALDILHGKKKVEFRAYSKHYCERMYDKNVIDYINKFDDDSDVVAEIGNFVNPLRIVRQIHFHNYNNTWHLDCEVTLNDIVSLKEEDAEYMRNEFGCHELDEEVARLEAARVESRPMYFYFVIGDILDTNLK